MSSVTAANRCDGETESQTVLQGKKGLVAFTLLCLGLAAVGVKTTLFDAGTTETRRAVGDKERALSYSSMSDKKQNTGIIFIKPHASTDAVMRLVHKRMRAEHVEILSRGVVRRDTVHYRLIWSVDMAMAAFAQAPQTIQPTENGRDAFLAAFGKPLEAAFAEDTFLNAAAAMETMSLTPRELYGMWRKLIPGQSRVKLSTHVWVGKMQNIFVVNGFYPAVAETYVDQYHNLRYLEVRWKPSDLSQTNFTSLLTGGNEDPSMALETSLRGHIHQDWEALGLESEPDILHNAVVATPSAFDAWLAAGTWLDQPWQYHSFARAVISRGLLDALLSSDIDAVYLYKNKQATLRGHLDGLDRVDCLNMMEDLLLNHPSQAQSPAVVTHTVRDLFTPPE